MNDLFITKITHSFQDNKFLHFYAEIQYGRQNCKNGGKTIFGKKLQLTVSKSLSHTTSEINASLHFTQKFKMAAKCGGHEFGEKSPVDSADILRVKHFVEIALSRSVIEINAFLHFTQKFKMATKCGGKKLFAKSHQ